MKFSTSLSPPNGDSGDENSNDGLQIVIENPRSKRRLMTELDEFDKKIIACVEKDLEENLEEKAAKANLTAQNVKNILKHVCTNEEVLALLRHAENPDDVTQPITAYEPKFTRSKTKEYLSTNAPNTIIPWVAPPKSSKVQVLFSEELQEDSSGDEYVPNKKRKIQNDLNSSVASSIEEKNIALRTRSKFSLSETPLEEIEGAFMPPDITTDMYDMNCDDDDWKEFLNTFTRPLEEVAKANEDEDHDPEYNILADEEIDEVDKEELRADRAVTVSRKELNNLMAELFEYADMYNDELREKNCGNFNVTEDTQIVDDPDDSECNTNITIQKTQIPILAQQMRQHVQMLTQNFLLTYEHPEFGDFASQFKECLLSFQKALENKTASMFYTINLFPALKLIEDWEQLFATKSEQVLETKLYIERVLAESINAKHAGTEYIVTFPPLVMETISKSEVFLYPNLLPRIPFKSTKTLSSNPHYFFTYSEDQLIALFLDQCMPAIKQDSYHIVKGKGVNIKHVSHYVHKYLFPFLAEHKIDRHIKKSKHINSPENPIKYYFRTKKVTPTIHYVFPVDPNNILPPCRVQPNLLPYLWREYNYPNWQKEKIEQTSVAQTKVASPHLYPVVSTSNSASYDIRLSKKVVARRRRMRGTVKCRKIVENIQNTAATTEEEELMDMLRDMPSLGAAPLKSPNITDVAPPKEQSETVISENQELSFQNILQQCASSSISGDVKRNFQEVSEFSLNGQFEITSPNTSTEKDNPDDINELMKACTTIKSMTKKEPSGAEKKRAKLRREYLANLMMATPDDPETESQKQDNFAIAFFDKIQEILEESDCNKAIEILSRWGESNRKFRDFYEDLQAILEPKYKELSDEFLLFLTAIQANSVGKLMPHFLMKNMTGFIKKMLIYFKDQPTQLKKINKALTDLVETPDVKMEVIKSSILPLLKGNVALTELFLQIFPDETPPKLLTNGPYEVVDIVKEMARQPGEENYETIVVPDTDDPYGGSSCICNCHNDDSQQFTQHCTRCGLKFIQGKVYVQTGKALRPAIVSFLTNPEKDHTKRLSATIRKRSDTSPNKQVTSPNKDPHPQDEPRNSNESEDDCDGNKKKTKRKRKVNHRDKPTMGKYSGKCKDSMKVCDKVKPKAKARKPTKKRVNVKKSVEHKPGSRTGQLKRLAEESLEIEYNAPAEFVELKVSSDHSGESESEFFESSQDITNTDSDESNEPATPIQRMEGADNGPWTREEDKIILQTFQQRSDCEETLQHISHVLQNRSVIEIKNRFRKLMSLLQQMAKKPTS